jgi:glycosyltransferase involved in cell wall biosynthesis
MLEVSVCIPAYRAAGYFERTLRSVLDQKDVEYEVVVSDDSPGEEVGSVVRGLADDRVRYLKNRRRLGSPANWEAAVERARAPYVKLMHHDDWFVRSDSLRRFVDLLDRDPGSDFGFCASVVANSFQERQRVHRPAHRIRELRAEPRVLLLGNWIGSPSATIYRRSAPPGFDHRLRWVVDIDMYLSILTRNGRFAYTRKPLVATTSGAPHQVTASVQGMRDVELFEWFQLYGKWAPPSPLDGEYASFLEDLLERFHVDSSEGAEPLGLRGRAAGMFAETQLRRVNR